VDQLREGQETIVLLELPFQSLAVVLIQVHIEMVERMQECVSMNHAIALFIQFLERPLELLPHFVDKSRILSVEKILFACNT
jgi:hypothetical protein